MKDEKIFNLETSFDLVDELPDEYKEALAAVSLNPAFNWAKLVLTDDAPNANGQKVPLEEFSNLIRTGYFAPIKMAKGKINEGHEDSEPLGVITHLKQTDNQIRCMAALWSRERPGDIEYLKNKYEKGEPLNISWEILYTDSRKNENGVEELLGTSLRAATIVGMPAYAGRTPITALASVENKEEGILDEKELEQLKADLEKAKLEVSELQSKLNMQSSELEELASLREYKSAIEAEKAKIEKLMAIKVKFSSAGIEKEEVYFETNSEMLLKMDEQALDFFIQELVSFKPVKNSTSSVKVPPVNGEPDMKNAKVLAKLLRESLTKK